MDIKGTLLIIILLIFFTQCEKEQFDPWGVWNTEPAEKEMRIRIFSTGKYYEVPFGLYIVKHCNEAITIKDKFPAIVIPGEYTEIEKYEYIENGFIFYLIGPGFKYTSEGPEFQDDTRIQVKMYFINRDECYFKYVSLEDDNGFRLSHFPDENVIYKRYRVNMENKKIFNTVTFKKLIPKTERDQTQ